MNKISHAGTRWNLLHQLRCAFLIAIPFGLMATGGNAQCLFNPPEEPCWFDLRTSVAAVSRNTDTLDIFAEDSRGYAYWTSWQPGSPWKDWVWLSGLQSNWNTSAISAVSRSTDHWDIFAVDKNFHVETAFWDLANGWHGWETIGDLTVGAVTAVSRSTDKLDIFAVGSDGQVYTAAWEPGFTGWHGWGLIPGVHADTGNTVTAVSRVTDALDIFVVDTSGTVQTASWQPGFTAWSAWHAVPGVHASEYSAVTAVKWYTNFVNLFLTDLTGKIQTTLMFPAFAGWQQIGLADPGATITGVSRRPTRLDVFVSKAGSVWQNSWEIVSPNWAGWQPIPNFTAAPGIPIGAVSRSLNNIDLYAVGADHNVWTAASASEGNNWSVFELLLPIYGYGHP